MKFTSSDTLGVSGNLFAGKESAFRLTTAYEDTRRNADDMNEYLNETPNTQKLSKPLTPSYEEPFNKPFSKLIPSSKRDEEAGSALMLLTKVQK